MADLFGLAEQRLAYIDQRQRLVAQNIANADTPDYQPRDLVSFDKLLRLQPVVPSVTDAMHLAGLVQNASLVREVPVERAVDGNAVSTEGQLTKIAEDETNAALVGNLWKTYMGMYMTALGKSG
jgi:flagellar basal-body rod protein FlgB